MPGELVVALLPGLILVSAVCAIIVMANRSGVAARILAMVMLIPIAGFCMFGFAASFEPGNFHVVWRVLYAVLFVACVAGAGRLLLTSGNPTEPTNGDRSRGDRQQND